MERAEVVTNHGTGEEPQRGGRGKSAVVDQAGVALLPNGTTEASVVERLKEKKEPSLGELNPLLFPPDLTNPEAVEALSLVIGRKIEKYKGLPPTTLETAYVPTYNGPQPRLVARFEIDTISERQLGLLEQLVHQTYATVVRTRTSTGGTPITPIGYPAIEEKKTKKGDKATPQGGKLIGWYMGSNTQEVESSHMGLFVFRDLGDAGMASYLRKHSAKEWFLKKDLVNPISGNPLRTNYLVEIREGWLYQTDIVEFVTQVSSILGGRELTGHRQLLYEVYNDLNRLGLKKRGKDAIFGLDEDIDRIDRVLVLPLANLALSGGIDLYPGSVLLVGVPGTGKTLIAEHFLQQDNGVFLVPVDPLHLAEELSAPPEKKRLLPRISQVFNQTGIPVIVHIDDIENIAKEDQLINSSLLNLMAGVRASGFFVLASTNHPEKLNPQLLQPQRFAHLIYMGLPEDNARRGILDVHATRVSKELGRSLFGSDEQRAAILDTLADQTANYTPRYLAEIGTEAKSFYLQRIAKARQTSIGLTEGDIDDTFSVEDWVGGFAEVEKKYNKKSVVDRDEEIQKFVENFYRKLGFHPGQNSSEAPLRTAIERRLAALLEQTPPGSTHAV